jgi:hypothetical protein
MKLSTTGLSMQFLGVMRTTASDQGLSRPFGGYNECRLDGPLRSWTFSNFERKQLNDESCPDIGAQHARLANRIERMAKAGYDSLSREN